MTKKNYRKHSEQNKKRIRKSLTECGAGRSVLVDKDGCLIAGNGVYEQAEKMGIKTRVVETDGTELPYMVLAILYLTVWLTNAKRRNAKRFLCGN